MLTRTRRAIYQAMKNPSFFQAENLFLLSHTRSRSTLLAHILGSNDAINGYYESHISFDGLRAQFRHRFLHAGEHTLKAGGRYFLDKNLHNENQIGERFFGQSGSRYLFLLREPASSITSMIEMHLKFHPHDPPDELVERFTDYYVTRLSLLRSYWDHVGKGQRLFVDSDDLVGDRKSTFARLERFLALSRPLSEEYGEFPYTGKPIKGDPSDAIKSRRILEKKQEKRIIVSAEMLEAPLHSYLEMKNHCSQKSL